MDPATGKFAFRVRIEGRNPEHAAFWPDCKWVPVSAEDSQVVAVIDTAAKKEVKQFKVGEQPWGVLLPGGP